jgi:hypothetical protein
MRIGKGRQFSTALWGLAPAILFGCGEALAIGQDTLRLETLMESLQEQAGLVDTWTDLEYLMANPVDLNASEPEDLLRVPFLRSDVVDSILAFRMRSGRLRDLRELVARGWLSEEELQSVRPFLRLGHSPKNGAELRLRYRLPPEPGPPAGVYSRFSARLGGGLQLGWVTERDIGEERWDDFRTAALSWMPKGSLRVLVGDYWMRLGQGLLFAGPYASRPGVAFSALFRKRDEIGPYLSASECWPLRGVAVLGQTPTVSALVFGSYIYRDGVWDAQAGLPIWDLDGYHRTASELRRRAGLREWIVGARVHGRKGIFRAMGLTFARTEVSDRWEPVAHRAGVSAFGLDWYRRLPGAVWFGEIAGTSEDPCGVITGLYLAGRTHELLLVGHRTPRDGMRWFRANSFALADELPEAGLCLAGSWKIGRSQVGLVFSQRHPSQVEGPSWASAERLWFAEISVRRGIRLQIRAQEKLRTARQSYRDAAGRSWERTESAMRRSFRAEIEARSGPIGMRCRVEPVWIGDVTWRNPHGLLLIQELAVQPARQWDVRLRISRGDVRHTWAAVYAYEPDVPGTFYLRSFTGQREQIVTLVQVQLASMSFSTKISWVRDLGSSTSDQSISCQLDWSM